MARTVKDIFCRYKTLKGFQVKRKGGWDTHGLPVELQVEKELGITKEDIGKKITVEEYNKKCRETVMRFKSEWDDLTEKMGYWVDLDNPYITFENNYIESCWYLLKELYKKKLLYKGYTIQPYSPAAGTGLSSHELNQPGCYRDVKDTTVVAQFKVKSNSKIEISNFKGDIYFLAWTTTPWTLPSNSALAVGEKANQAFTAAGAHEAVAGSLRRLLRLDEALEHAEAATSTLRELGARWELASTLGDRGMIHRLAGRLEEAERDLREAFLLCHDLKERALVTWTAAELARILALRGDTAAARQILNDPSARIAEGEPGSATALLVAEAVVALAERDRETALSKSLAALEAERGPRGLPNPLAALTVWTGVLFGAEEAGGEEAVEQARAQLRANGWHQAIAEPDMATHLLG